MDTINRPFSICLLPLFQNESFSKTFHLHGNESAEETDFNKNGFARM